MTDDFRPIPGAPGYSASQSGLIRRDKPRRDGSPWYLAPGAKGVVILKVNGQKLSRVASVLVRLAFSDDPIAAAERLLLGHNPKPVVKATSGRSRGAMPRSQTGGAIVTLKAYRATLRAQTEAS